MPQFKQVHGLNPEQDTNLEELRNETKEIIDVDRLGGGQVVSPVLGRVPQNGTDVFVNLFGQRDGVITVEQEG